MEAWKRMLVHVAWSGLFISGFPGATLLVEAQQAVVPETQQQQEGTASSNQTSTAKGEDGAKASRSKLVNLPDSPGTIASRAEKSQAQAANENAWELAAALPQTGQSQSSTSSSSSSESAPQRPVGTAAAEAPNASGVAASQPAGVAIAPAKQRRVRTIVIRTGAIIAAGVAVGTVVALTAATPSKPPGAH